MTANKPRDAMLHSGHRDRVRQKFLQHGLDAFSDHEVLELALFFAIPRNDVNELAHRLIERFGSLFNVLNASAIELQQTDGVGEAASALLTLIPQIERKCQISLSSRFRQTPIMNAADAAKLLQPFFLNQLKEVFYGLTLNNAQQQLSLRKLFTGSVSETSVSIREVMEFAIQDRATGLIIAHNHPSGVPFASQGDISQTDRLQDALKIIKVRLNDHIIFAHNEWTSMRETQTLRDM
jgi:DNA repair protein RadC